MRTAIVFGGAGQFGGVVAEHLIAAGWHVSVVTHDGRKPPVSLTERDARILDGTGKTREAVIREFGAPVDAVFNSTAYNAADAHDLLEARTRYGGLVVVSSCSVYADPQGRSLDESAQTGFPDFDGLMTEDTPTVAPGPQSYSTNKVAMERALLSSGVATTVLRPCAVYGRGATHPREWWFIKRGLDERRAIPVAYNAQSLFHTSSTEGIASLATLCMDSPASRILNVADPSALTVGEIASAIEDATGLSLPLAPFDGAPVGPSRVGGTPWSTELPYVLDTSRATALGWDGGGDYRTRVAEVCKWVLEAAREGDWRARFIGFARYGYDPFDYEAEDRFLENQKRP